jgi:hypothetical protein
MKNKQNYTVIVNCNLEYTFKVKSPEEAKEMAENVELPKEYVTDSFEIIKTIDEKGKEYYV